MSRPEQAPVQAPRKEHKETAPPCSPAVNTPRRAQEKPAPASPSTAVKAATPTTALSECPTPPPPKPGRATSAWTAEHEQLLAAYLAESLTHREGIGSLEIERLIRGEALRLAAAGVPPGEAEAMAADHFKAVLAQQAARSDHISSPAAAPSPGAPSQSWFSVNAELVVYGAAGPDATVMIGDRQVRLRPDGSFSYRFALPDGVYELPIAATNAAGESRRIRLAFSRSTLAEGEVQAHPQDPSLKTAAPENVE